jgi:putative serine protease PepD
MVTQRNGVLLFLMAGIAVIAAGIALVVAVSDNDEGNVVVPADPASKGGGDPSPAFVAAAKVGLASVVQIRHESGLGSGVVLDGDGDIVTNAHVVAGGKSYKVVTPDGKEHPATLRGSFPQGDIAVVRVSGVDLKAARFADSSKLEVGQAVLALGSPLGLRGTVTDGIVSAVSRTVSEGNGVALPSAVQTDAPINPGNSGGALVDLSGAVVGIPTLVAVTPGLGGAADGVGFAISSNTAKNLATQLAEHGRVVDTGRAYLGVELRSLPSGGVLIVGVQPGGPAADAGLKPGDLILEIDGEPVATADDVAVALASHKPGEKVTVKVRRQDGSSDDVEVTLGELPAAG